MESTNTTMTQQNASEGYTDSDEEILAVGPHLLWIATFFVVSPYKVLHHV